jgi:hypothetical protein
VIKLAANRQESSCANSEQGGQRAKFHPTQPPMGPVGSWDGLEAVQGVQLGHRATWFGGGRARSPTGASASSFASSPYKWLAPGRQGVASVRPMGLRRRCKYMPRHGV